MNDRVFGWCYCKCSREWWYLLLYWKCRLYKGLEGQMTFVKLLMYTSGFMSEDRGKHWNRYCKLKRN